MELHSTLLLTVLNANDLIFNIYAYLGLCFVWASAAVAETREDHDCLG